MLRKFLCAAAVAVSTFAFSAPAQAGIVQSVLTFEGTIDVIADDSRGILVDQDFFSLGAGDGVVGTIDLIQGIVSLPNATATDPGTIYGSTGGNLFGAYSIALTAVPGGPYPITLAGSAPTTAGFGFLLTEMLGIGSATGMDATGLSTKVAGITPTVAIFEQTVGAGPLNDTAFTNTGGPGGVASAPMVLNFLGSTDLSGLTVDILAGFDGADDFYLGGLFLPPGVPGGPLGVFDGAFTVVADVFGSDVKYVPIVDSLGRVGDIVVGSSDGNPDGLGSIESLNQGGYTFSDSGNFLVNAVPEPSSFLAFAAIGFAGLIRRRNRV